MTLAVTPDEAEKLTLIDESGSVRLSLRPPEERYAPLSLGTSIPDIVAYRPTHEEIREDAKAAEEERKAAEKAYLDAMRDRTGYREPIPGGDETKIILPPLEPGAPPPVEVEVILGGKSEKVTLPAEETWGIYSVLPKSYGYGRIFPMTFYSGE